MNSSFKFQLAAFLLIWDAGLAPAQETGATVKAVETPWTVACQPVTDANTIACEMTKQIRTENPASFIAQISVLTTPNGLSMRIVAPHQLSIANGISISVDEGAPSTRPFTTSLSLGIVSLFAMDETILDSFRAGAVAKVSAKTRTDQDFSFTISLAGFAATMDKLPK